MKVLVADDDPDLLAVLCQLLSESGYDVTCTTSLEEVLGLLKGAEFDVCLLDLVYSGEGVLDIYEVADRAPCRLVLMTAYTKGLDMDWLERRGVKVLKKPFGVTELFSAINEAEVLH